MELRLQPKPLIDIEPASKGIVSKEKFFVKKVLEKVNDYFFPALLARQWRPKVELLYTSPPDEGGPQYECDFNREIQNCFVEDFAEEVYLKSPPPCFVVLGKFGAQANKLSRDIAKEYGSVLIEVQEVVDQVIRMKNEIGIFLDKVLRLGVSITLNFVLSLVSYLAHTAEARHRGYVLCGLPCPPLGNDLSVEQQLDYLFCWENKPTILVYVSFEDEDLIRWRYCLRHEVKAVENDERCLLIPHFQCDEFEEKYRDNLTDSKDYGEGENEDELSENDSSEPDVNICPSQPRVRLPQNDELKVWYELELFDKGIKPAIDSLLSRIDPQYVITVDSRTGNEFEIVKSRLTLLKIWKSPVPFPLLPLKGEEAEDLVNDEELSEIRRVAEEPPETAFLTLFSKRTLSPKFRWELSHYNYICPVSLRAGEVTEGKSEFAVGFMKYIYFLRDDEAMKLFLKNPRPFVLPIKPKPPSRFFLIGYPFCGKTTLARSLAEEFSIPLINLDQVLKSDLEKKKNIYMEFCKQKAESRELQRLTSQAWKDWRLEEEQRVSLIEDWIAYVQSLLEHRIEQFYSGKTEEDDKKRSQSGTDSESREGEAIEESGRPPEGLEIRGITVDREIDNQSNDEVTLPDNYSTPSTKIIKALKHEDYDFEKKGFEVEANLFFSALWNSFSSENVNDVLVKSNVEKVESEEDKDVSNMSIAGEDITESNISINWCTLLPPQSLSSLLLQKEPYTLRKRRKSFRILLAAASKAYWDSSSLKLEFAKWRLPCFMDIPLCEIFVDNPLLLFKYCPEWIKHRPLIPDSVDPKHPAVVEAGRKAYNQAKVVTLSHTVEDIALLLRDEIERAERNGMRITGDVISPGGWVIDNMTLDLQVWCMLTKESIRATHVYILTDSQPEWRRIITTWFDIYNRSSLTLSSGQPDVEKTETTVELTETETEDGNDFDENDPRRTQNEETEKKTSRNSNDESLVTKINMVDLVMESCLEIARGESELDEVYENLTSEIGGKSCMHLHEIPIDPFSYHILLHKFRRSKVLDDSILEEFTLNTVNFSETSRFLFSSRSAVQSTQDLGAQLEIFTGKVLNILQDVHFVSEDTLEKENSYENGIKFFFLLLTLSRKLENLKEWLNSLSGGTQVKEIDIYGKTSSQVFAEILKELYKPFGKRPRELETFELEEIKKAFQIEEYLHNKKMKKENMEEEEEEKEGVEAENDEELQNYEDPRIYGESGPFCIVNLERNILLGGNPKYVLRYYGKLYFFWNEESKLKFIEDPTKYAPYYSPIRCLPPMRIFLLGPFGTEKSLLASAISEQCGVHFVDCIKFINKQLIPHVVPTPSKLMALEASLLVDDAHNKDGKQALEEFKNAPYKKRMFWLENPPFYASAWDKDDSFRDLLNLQDSHVRLDDVELLYESIDVEPKNNKIPNNGETFKMDEYDETPPEEFIPLNEVVNTIQNYIHKDMGLTEHCVNKSLKLLWDRIPYATEGFVLKDFPLRSFDCRIITKNNWIPDIVIEMNATEEEIIEANIEKLMEFWEAKLRQQMAEEQLLEDTVRTIQEIKIMRRRLELMSEKHEFGPESLVNIRQSFSLYTTTRRAQETHEKMTGKTNKTDRKSSLRSNNDHLLNPLAPFAMKNSETFHDTEVEEILKEEFPTLTFNPIFESYEEGRARIIEDMRQNYQKDMSEINKIKSELQSMSVPWWKMSSSKDTNDLFIFLDHVKKKFNQRGEFAFETSVEMAEKLLERGFYFLSKFGRFCPVQAFRQKNPVNMFAPLKSKKKIFPVCYRSYIYFVGGSNEKIKFIEDPIKYTFQDFHRPEIPLRLSVIGPPKSGKTLLCKRLGLMFGLKVVTMGTAIRFVLEKMRGSELEKSLNGYLKRGSFLPLSLKMKALAASLNDPECLTQGYVFDGIPFDAATTQSLAEKKHLPFLVICLTCDSQFGKENRQNLDLTGFRLPYKQRVNLDDRYNEWNKTYEKFALWNENTYHNLYEINAKTNSADIFYKAYDLMKKPYFDILHYVEFCVSNKALPLRNLCINQQEFDSRKGPLEDNCPVCWTENHRLTRPSDDQKLHLGLVQYADYFYWVCPQQMDAFVKNPKRYLPPHGGQWPTVFPRALNKYSLEILNSTTKIHGHGRCPVTRIDFPNSLDWEGSSEHMVFYKNEVFFCKNAEMMERFLARPWRYCKSDTTFEENVGKKSHAVVNLGPPKVTSLPPLGFLEQTVAQLLQEALQVLGSVRPVYPNLTPACTACVFVALYLKVNNKKRNVVPLEKEYLDFMIYYCKAYKFQVPFVGPRNHNIESEGDSDFLHSNSAESTARDFDEETKSSQGTLHSKDSYGDTWVDIECQADKKLWSANYINLKREEMILLSSDELQEIPEIPKRQVVLRYVKIRSSPLPPVSNCLTLIYCRKPNLKIPQEFNINTLYQPPPPFVSPYSQSIPCNPERQFSMSLFKRAEPKSAVSHPILTHEKQTKANSDRDDDDEEKDRFKKLHTELFMPRFQVLDVMHPIHHPMPVVVEDEPIVFEPHRDYTYTMLLSYFFQMSHVLKCYEWQEIKCFLEYSNLVDRNLGLTGAQSQFFYKPKVALSVKSTRSIESYQQTFDAKNTFFCRNFTPSRKESSTEEEEEEEEEEGEREDDNRNSSNLNFMQLLIFEKLDEMFSNLSETNLSYDSYETNILFSTSDPNLKPSVIVREVLPYPPLIWDIASRPYYSLKLVPVIFGPPHLENIAHERHVSLLDGIAEPNDIFRFVRYPTWAQSRFSQPAISDHENPRISSHGASSHKVYYYYDFFSLDWTAYLCYPFSWSYNTEIPANFNFSSDNQTQSIVGQS